MWLLILEALAALGLLAFLVWWTMFSGRRGGELDAPDDAPPDQLPGSTDEPAGDDRGSRGGSRKLKG